MTKEIDNIQDKMNWHWRNSMRPARFFMFDGRAALPLPVLILFPRLITLVIMIIFLLVFSYLERKGLSAPSAYRNFRSWIVGRYRPGWLPAYRKKFKDFG